MAKRIEWNIVGKSTGPIVKIQEIFFFFFKPFGPIKSCEDENAEPLRIMKSSV